MNIQEYRVILKKMDEEFGVNSMFDCLAKHHGESFFSYEFDALVPMTQEFMEDGSVLEWSDTLAEDVAIGAPTFFYPSVEKWVEKNLAVMRMIGF